MTETILKKRERWKDIAFGIAIISVVIGHSFLPNAQISKFVYLYHMPLFFILGGYFLNFDKYEFNFGRLVKNGFKRLIIPVFVACVILYNNCRPDWLIKFLYGSGKNIENLHIYAIDFSMWFIFCLFITKILTWLILKFQKLYNLSDFLVLIIAFIIALAGRAISTIILLPWSIDIAMTALYLSVVGFLIKKHKLLFEGGWKKQTLIISCSFIIAILDIMYTNIFNMNERIYGNILLSFNGAIAIVILICYISKAIENAPIFSKLLQYLGINSLVIMIVHGLFHSSINGFVNTVFRLLCSVIVIEVCSNISILLDVFKIESLSKMHTEPSKRVFGCISGGDLHH